MHLAKGGAFQYAIARFQATLLPSGFRWTDEAVAEPTGRGETIEGEQLDAHCSVKRNAEFGSCTVTYFLTTESRNPLIPCTQKIRARNLAPRGALRTARRRGEFIPSETRIHGGNAYSYLGYAISCVFQDPKHTEVVYPGDRN
jgi:hypothetical protein